MIILVHELIQQLGVCLPKWETKTIEDVEVRNNIMDGEVDTNGFRCAR
jgi:hypothetical protein